MSSGVLETALQESMRAYREVLGELTKLRGLSLSTPAQAIAASAEAHNLRLENAYQTHLAVNDALKDNPAEAADLRREWQDLVTRVAEENRLLSGRFRGMMSVVAAEMSRIKGGRTALKGYKPGRDTKGGRLKGAF